MIRYALKCDQNHTFESWFQNAAAFDGLRAAGHVTCPDCGSAKVEKSLMAPKVRPARAAAMAPVQAKPGAPASLASPNAEIEAEIARLRAKVEAESEYVGGSFAREARAMHLGDAPERSIYGEAKLADAKELLEDGVPVMPLPFTPTRKAN
ncbi:DUF1178 family protein [Aliiroseovarius sp. Z3]|uniref:DUF1178 family protein n=1 Tax=Aliiroseovarius sp. Z3 TaxID=2811402 RepID=UPI0023B27956|nr:DUF1178 family protein [Aliiroseovarius sp. Z3]MDE9451725.1 DUF1178 family protein [Aliiroseovarius sp. Z3]